MMQFFLELFKVGPFVSATLFPKSMSVQLDSALFHQRLNRLIAAWEV
jgi:hypothetical protein